MKLLFKQRFFSWFDSYDVYDEEGKAMFVVKGQMAWGHLLRIYDANGEEVAHIKEKVFSFLPKFEMYVGGECVGYIKKEFSLFKPKFKVDYNGWRVQGDWFEWNYKILDLEGQNVATISKEIFKLTDTYAIDVLKEEDALSALMLVLAIDAEKCSKNEASDDLD